MGLFVGVRDVIRVVVVVAIVVARVCSLLRVVPGVSSCLLNSLPFLGIATLPKLTLWHFETKYTSMGLCCVPVIGVYVTLRRSQCARSPGHGRRGMVHHTQMLRQDTPQPKAF